MLCRLVPEKCVEVGDHVVVVAKVLSCGGYAHGDGIGLVYAEGGYWNVGVEIDMELVRTRANDQQNGFRRPFSHLYKDRTQTASSDSGGEYGECD